MAVESRWCRPREWQWRSQGVDRGDNIHVTTNGEGADESQGADREAIDWSDITDTGDLGIVVAVSVRGGERVPEDWGEARGKQEPTVAIGMEGQRSADVVS